MSLRPVAANDNNTPDLFTQVKTDFGAATAKAVQSLFNQMSMPIPEEHEYTHTNDGRFLLFLNEPACIISLNSEDLIVHDHVLQPFGSVKTGKLRADFLPGVISPAEYMDLEEVLARDHISYWDTDDTNEGEIAGWHNAKKHTVVVDMGSITTRENYKPTDTPVQSQHYRPLREAFARVWNPGAEIADTSELINLWDTCRIMKAEGKLVAGWMDAYAHKPEHDTGFYLRGFETCNYKNMVPGSTSYSRRWIMPTAMEKTPALTVSR